jgi:two-component system cell cycle sensor histidine kinase/response regulator CckA
LVEQDAPRAVHGELEASGLLAAIVESSMDAVTATDREGRITSWNPAAERLYGWTAEEAIGRHISVISTDIQEFRHLLGRWTAGARVAPYETTRRHRDGSVVEVSISISPVRDASGQVVGGAAVSRDIGGRRRAAALAAVNERRYRLLIGKLPDAAILEYDRDLRIVWSGGLLAERSGWLDLRGKTLHELLPAEALERLVEPFEAALPGRSSAFEWQSTGGATLNVDMVPANHEQDGEVTGVLVLARDVTDRQRIRRHLDFQAALLDHLDVGVIATDADGIVTHWNRAAEIYSERPRDTILGRPVTDVTTLYDLTDASVTMARLVQGETNSQLLDIRRSDGAIRPTLITSSAVRGEDGRLAGFVAVLVDLTTSHQAQQTLKRAQALSERAFERAPVGMALFEAQGEDAGSIVQANQALGALLRRDPDHLAGRRLRDLLAPEDLSVLEHDIDGLLRGDRDSLQAEIRLVAAGGEPVWVKFSGSLIRGPRQEPLHAVALMEDRTEVRRAEAEKAALEAVLQRSQRLEGLGRLAGGIAHDFNNLLAVILGYSVLVADQLPDGDRLRGDVEQITDAAERAAALTRQLLAFGRREMVRPRAIDLGEVVTDTQKLLRRTLGEHVELEVRLGADLWPVRADRGQLEQVLLNLVVNGRDAMPDGGPITIETGNLSIDEPGPERPVTAAGRWVRLAVRDTGTGMAPEVKEHAFEPFFTTKPQGVGTGLGLATVYGIVTEAGGHVELHSGPGDGTTVEILLPAVDADAPEDPVSTPAGRTAGRGERVLVVEDDPSVRMLVGRVLRDAGYAVLHAGGPAEAIELAAGAPVDLLLTDVVMPGMSGRELVAALRATRRDLPVLYMSGHTGDVVMSDGRGDAAVAFLPKPFDHSELLAAVRTALDAGVASG